MEQQADTIRPLEEQPWDGVHVVNAKWLAANGEKSVSWASLDKKIAWLSKMLIEQISKATRERLKELETEDARLAERIAELESQVATLKEAQTKTLADAFRGGWQPNTHYTRGSLVVKDGALWLAMAEASTKPGSSGEWRLVTKAGKDGKDLVR